jgi:hypothetical protein
MIYAKTELGRRALQTREIRLTPCQRAVFIMADGQRPVGDLLRTAQSMGGGQDDINALIALGVIAPTLPPPPPPPVAIPASAAASAAKVAGAPAITPRTRLNPEGLSRTSALDLSGFRESENLPPASIFDAPQFVPPPPSYEPDVSVYGNVRELEEVSGFAPEESFQDAKALAVRLLQPHGLRARQVLRAVEESRNIADLQNLAPLVHDFLTPGEAAAFDSMFGAF